MRERKIERERQREREREREKGRKREITLPTVQIPRGIYLRKKKERNIMAKGGDKIKMII